jgi:hypothetical protein
MPNQVKKLTPVLLVDAIEPCLPFWVDRLGWTKTAEVPHGSTLGFVILAKDDIELMYQTWESAREDVGAVAPSGGTSVGLFIEVGDLAAIERQIAGMDIALPRRRTFYGTDEIGVREPGGHLVIFAQPVAK